MNSPRCLLLLAIVPLSSWAQGTAQPTAFENAVAGVANYGREVSDRYEADVAQARSAVEAGQGAADAYGAGAEAYNALNDLDRQLDDAMAEPRGNAPPIPASCVRREGCEDCYSEAYERLGRARVLLARAQTIYKATHRFAAASVALGDNLAPSTREAALVWQAQKPAIERSLATFDQAYDRKIEAMLGNLKEVLQMISRCEAQYYNNPDWYTRYGFMYLEFMAARYTRN